MVNNKKVVQLFKEILESKTDECKNLIEMINLEYKKTVTLSE